MEVKPKITVKENILNEAQITNTNTKINFSNFKIKNILDFSSMKPEIIADVERFDGGYFDGTTLILDRHELPEEKYSNEVVKASKFIDAIKLDINTAYKVTSTQIFLL
ncbi:MAG: hypothetical protein KatS3mg085_530 [Candidatus Dojkabacteria bacterium]|nr:MAG: hypothetical protein KatS3mg085_530 [Candidatus Dojkabacteria bacterium]